MDRVASDTEHRGNRPASSGWHLVAVAREIKPGEQVRRVFMGQPVLIGRTLRRALFAMRDICPHRGVPLSPGKQIEAQGETTVECPYHGWRFGLDGVCRLIPSLVEGDPYSAASFKTARYGVVEASGLVFLAQAPELAPSALALGAPSRPPELSVRKTFAQGPTPGAWGQPAWPEDLFSHLGWSRDARENSWVPQSLGAKRLSRRAGTCDRRETAQSWVFERLATPHGKLSVLVAITPISAARAEGHVAFWWEGLSWFRASSAPMARAAHALLDALGTREGFANFA